MSDKWFYFYDLCWYFYCIEVTRVSRFSVDFNGVANLIEKNKKIACQPPSTVHLCPKHEYERIEENLNEYVFIHVYYAISFFRKNGSIDFASYKSFSLIISQLLR